MNFGLSDQHYQQLLDLVINPLKKLNATVYIFGSRAQGKHHPFSDIDILYSVSNKASISREVFLIKESIEESNFPIKVDLVNEAELAKSYVSSVLASRQQV